MQEPKAASELIDRGFAAFQSGDAAMAKDCCAKALQLAPDYPDALHLLGLIFAAERDFANAVALIERAIAADPNEPMFRLNIVAAYERMNDAGRALGHLRAASRLAPGDAQILMQLASAELRANNFDAAAATYEAAYRLNPGNVNALIGAIRVKHAAGATADVLRLALAARDALPSNVEVLKLACAAAIEAANWLELWRTAAMWRCASPSDMDAHRNLARAYTELGDGKNARDAFKPVIASGASSPADLAVYARLCLSAFDYEAAQQALDDALKIAPDMGAVHYALARHYLFLGDLEASERHCRRAIALDPEYPPSYAHLVSVTKGDVDDETLALLLRKAADAASAVEHRASLYLAAGAAFHRRGNYADAMQAFSQGNALTADLLRATGGAYDAEKADAERERDIAVFSGAPAPARFAAGPATPIFIVGAPRSGTTLIESVLAAHPNVFGAGELAGLPLIHKAARGWADKNAAKDFSGVPPEQLTAWREQYFSAWPELGGKTQVVDKQPLNICSVGLIRTLFPEAPIIHIRRNPVETCFSIYRHDFSKGWAFACSLSDVARYYGQYARIMAHWHVLFGDRLAFVQYEDFVENFEAEARRLIACCGLEWSDACLAFHETKRPVATFSSVQVRSPVTRRKESAVDQYGGLLDPLLAALGEAGVDLETGALAAGA